MIMNYKIIWNENLNLKKKKKKKEEEFSNIINVDKTNTKKKIFL